MHQHIHSPHTSQPEHNSGVAFDTSFRHQLVILTTCSHLFLPVVLQEAASHAVATKNMLNSSLTTGSQYQSQHRRTSLTSPPVLHCQSGTCQLDLHQRALNHLPA